MNAPRPISRPFLILPAVLLVCGGLALIARSRPADQRKVGPSETSPEECIARMLAAERAGDVAEYLGCLSEPERANFESLWRERPESQVARELRDRAAGLVGHAISNVELEGSDRASLVLERIEKDHTARQRIDLCLTKQGWQIARLAAPDWQAPTIPYGTPVFTPRGAARRDRE